MTILFRLFEGITSTKSVSRETNNMVLKQHQSKCIGTAKENGCMPADLLFE